ncbi:MAG: thioredoxin family protein [Candidatus Neomarinimicrobiota bacterium]
MLNKKFILIFNLIFLISGLSAGLKSETNPAFDELSLPAALEAGKSRKKPVVVKFHADWCHFCNKMDKQTYTDKKIKSILGNFISIKVNVDTKIGLAQARLYGVSALPAILVFDRSGKLVYSQAGFHSAEQFEYALQKGND